MLRQESTIVERVLSHLCSKEVYGDVTEWCEMRNDCVIVVRCPRRGRPGGGRPCGGPGWLFVHRRQPHFFTWRRPARWRRKQPPPLIGGDVLFLHEPTHRRTQIDRLRGLLQFPLQFFDHVGRNELAPFDRRYDRVKIRHAG